ncbi:MAG: hypothetical protein OMOMHJEC_03042 [Xanthomonadales bacterium]|nr:hypothetical protein [Xanthomonadales bacterium]
MMSLNLASYWNWQCGCLLLILAGFANFQLG